MFEKLASSDQGRDMLKENKLLPEIANLLKLEIDVKEKKRPEKKIIKRPEKNIIKRPEKK